MCYEARTAVRRVPRLIRVDIIRCAATTRSVIATTFFLLFSHYKYKRRVISTRENDPLTLLGKLYIKTHKKKTEKEEEEKVVAAAAAAGGDFNTEDNNKKY